jgi:hypothetical protein
MPPKEPSYIQACARCNSKKVKCLMRDGGPCEQCAALDAECMYVVVALLDDPAFFCATD